MIVLSAEEIEFRDRLWAKGGIVEGINPDLARKDACGAWIFLRGYRDFTDPYGWDIDHINPALRNNTDEPEENLRPMHVKNIESKGNSYPVYFSAVTADGVDNIRRRRQMFIYNIES